MNQLATTTPAPSIEGLEQVLINGDLASLSPEQAIAYYRRVCDSVGLNPLTQPFEYLRLNGKTILYARRAATEQLRKLHQVSITIVSRETVEGCYVVTARATLPSGRCDENLGVVPITGVKGEALANALMKAETKAKRRVTLAICGLAFLDESEAEGVRGAEHVPMPVIEAAPARAQLAPVVPIHADTTEATTAAALAQKLTACETVDQLVAWMRELFAANLTDEGIKRKLWTMCSIRCKQRQQDPNILAREAKKQKTKLETQLEASIAQAEV